MRRVSSRLSDNGSSVLVVAGVLLMLALCVCVLLPHPLTPEYGLRVRPEGSSFAIGAYDRANTHIISVTAGNPPMVFDGSEQLPDGMRGLAARMQEWRSSTDTPDGITVVFVVDKAVSVGTIQRLSDMTLKAGFRCCFANIPQLGS